MFQLPALLLSLLLASTYAALFTLWQGRRLRDLLWFWVAAVIGFGLGQVAGIMLGLIPWTLGQVHVIEGTLLAFVSLFVARWLRQDEKRS